MAKISCILAAVAAVLAGCASTPKVLRGDAYAPVSPNRATLEHRTGDLVRWGGSILSVSHEDGRTCFEVLGRPLDSRARPERTDVVLGRYRACAPGFYDPAVYTEGREITTVGRIEGQTAESFDSFELQVPVLAADVVYLWSERVYYAAPYPAYPYGYGWAWPYYTWGPYYGPWLGVGFGGPYYGYPYGYYRYPYGHGRRVHTGGGHLAPSGHVGRRIPAGGGGNVGRGTGGQRVPVGRH